jgi:hypothetical protein
MIGFICERIYCSPVCFGTIATSLELPLMPLMWIKMVMRECDLGRPLTDR